MTTSRTTTGWSGPWLSVVDRSGKTRPVPLAAGADPTFPAGTVKVAVRWRAPGDTNPRKRTFAAAAVGDAVALARSVQVAALLNLTADGAGMPPGALPGAGAGAGPAASPVAALVPAAPPLPAVEPDVAGSEEPTPVAGEREGTPALVGARELLPPAPTPLHLRAAGTGRAHWPQPGSELGPTVAEYVAHLKELHGPLWQEARNTFMPGQLDLMARFFTYPDGDPRAAHYGLPNGSSLHLWLMEPGDCAEALLLRRQVNLAAVRRNTQKQDKYDQAMERYQAAQDRPGRRPNLPTPPVFEVAVRERSETSHDPAISAGAETHFAMTCAFVFDRAYDGCAFPGANPWRVFNPRRNGGRASQARVIRRPDAGSSTSRSWPGLGFFADLGDALACRGAVLQPCDQLSARSGARYRLLPLIVTTLMLRPGEGVAARPEYSTPGRFEVTPVPGGHLKHRPAGETRPLDASALTGRLVQMHAEAGFVSRDGYLFSGPAGGRLDVSNFTEDFLRPALRELLAPGGRWDEHADLLELNDVWYLMRKAGESILLAHGLDPATAARWAGHDEAVMYAHYKGSVASGRNRIWHGIDAAVAAALAEQPPRGAGELATMLRQFAGVPQLEG